MGCSRETVLTCALSKLQANFDLPMSKADPAYKAMVDEFVEHLRPFDQWELQEGLFEFIHNSRTRKWPAVGAVVAACQQRKREGVPPDQRTRPRLEKPSKQPRQVSPEERRRVSMYLRVLGEWQANGKLAMKDEKGSYRYTVADCRAEGDRRLAEQDGQQAQAS